MKDFLGNIVEVYDKVVVATSDNLCPLVEGTVVDIIDNGKVLINIGGKEVVKHFNEFITISFSSSEIIPVETVSLVDQFNNLNPKEKIAFLKEMDCSNIANKCLNDVNDNINRLKENITNFVNENETLNNSIGKATNIVNNLKKKFSSL